MSSPPPASSARQLRAQPSMMTKRLDQYHQEILRDFDAEVHGLVESTFASRYVTQPTPVDRIPGQGMPSRVAYQLIHDIRQLDANPRLNLASFVTTWMEDEAVQLIKESLDVNYVDMDQYKSSTDIQNRCVKMLANLWKVNNLVPLTLNNKF